jgi:DNA-binding NtrC family response regulator
MSVQNSVLIADDSLPIRRGLQYVLGKKYEVLLAGTAGEALRTFQKARPDLVLLDLVLPDGDGFSVLQEIKRIDRKAHVVMLTVHNSIHKAVRAMKLGATDYLTKPIDLQVLKTTVRGIFAGKEDPLEIVSRTPSLLHVFEDLSAAAGRGQTAWLLGEAETGKRTLALAAHLADRKPRDAFFELRLGPEPVVDAAGLFDAQAAREHFNPHLGLTLYARIGAGSPDPEAGARDLGSMLDALQGACPAWQDTLGIDPDRFQLMAGVTTVRNTAPAWLDILRENARRRDVFTALVPTLDERREDIGPLSEFLTRRISRARPRPRTRRSSPPAWRDVVQPSVRNVAALEAFLRKQLAQ